MSVYFSPHRVKLLGSGSALPGEPLSNEVLLESLKQYSQAKSVRIAKRIAKKIGVENRHFTRDLNQAISHASPSAPELCQSALLSAAEEMLNNGKTKDQIEDLQLDYLVGHTTSPHTLLPPNIAWVAEKLKHEKPYLELRQACTGFANALQLVAPMINGDPNMKAIGIVGSETGSVYFDALTQGNEIEQLVNYMQMGDGAGAVIFGADDHSDESIISDIYMGHIGLDKQSGFYLEGGSRHPQCENNMNNFQHNTKHVVEYGMQLFQAGLDAIYSRGYQESDFDFIIPHQANGRMAKHIHKFLGIDVERIVVDADQVGNMGSAAIWYSFDKLRRSQKLKKGSKVLILGAEATKYLYGGFVYQH